MTKPLLIGTLAAAAATFAASPAAGGVMVVGSSSARLCYEAAESRVVTDQAAVYCDKALREDVLTPRDTTATYVNRGIVRFFRGNAEAALSDFDKALAQDPNQAEAYLNKGIVKLRQAGTANEALPLFTAALEKNTQKPALAYLGRGMAHELGGNVQAAYRDYRQASVLAPNWSAPRAELGRFKVVGN